MIGKLKTIVTYLTSQLNFVVEEFRLGYLLPKQVMGYDVCLQQFYPGQVNDTMSIYLCY